ncbi:hypothetical protein BAZSYMA_ACONTIG268170_1 [Bathymodiolus azoricus thioautotrophic gill symbiont]|uniref:Uncharacterized protein n=1 Tax=Bathymodiolus azoricus thioautotrophic gill symbiont TaxID=235205 RepID=A0A1H6L4J1_9GAMM|nr:hypothetical protein BAZSYMA_ACONTIG268170_1 [Bathymodiolus azoricus thioautotrophic gill symbiont]
MILAFILPTLILINLILKMVLCILIINQKCWALPTIKSLIIFC